MNDGRAYIYTALARIIMIGGQLAYVKIVTHFLDLPEVGLYYLLVTASYFANALIFVPFDYYQQSSVIATFSASDSLGSFIRPNILILSIFFSVVVMIAAITAGFSTEFALWILVGSLFSIGNYIPLALRGALNIVGYQREVNITQLIEGVLRPALGVAFVSLAEHPSAVMLLLSGSIASAIISASLLSVYKKKGLFGRSSAQATLDWDWLDIIKFTFPISLSALTNWVQLQGYRIVLVPLGYSEVVGVYAVLANLGHAGMGALSGIYSQVMLPKIYRSAGLNLNKYLVGASGLSLVAALALFALSPVLVPLVTNASYGNFSRIAIYGVLIDGLGAVIGGLIVYFSMKGKTYVVAKSSLFAAIFSCCGMTGLYFNNSVSPLSIGLILLTSQILSAAILYGSYLKFKSQEV